MSLAVILCPWSSSRRLNNFSRKEERFREKALEPVDQKSEPVVTDFRTAVMHQKAALRKISAISRSSNRICITEDLISLLEGFTVVTMDEKPADLVEFAADYFQEMLRKKKLLQERGVANLRTGFFLAINWDGLI